MSIGAVLSSILAIVLSLAFVIALAWGGLLLLRRFQEGRFGQGDASGSERSLRFVRALPLGPRERLVMVEIDGEQVLLGVTAHSITQLKTWPAQTTGRDGFDRDGSVSPSDPRERPRFRLPMAGRDDR